MSLTEDSGILGRGTAQAKAWAELRSIGEEMAAKSQKRSLGQVVKGPSDFLGFMLTSGVRAALECIGLDSCFLGTPKCQVLF